MKLYFLVIFSKNSKAPNFMKILPVGTDFFHVDRRADMAKIKSLFAICPTHLKATEISVE